MTETEIRNNILKYAKSLKSYTNYKMGAKYYNYNNNKNKPKLLDCSGFVVWCYKMVGLNVPDGTWYQWNNSFAVSSNQLQVGDIGIMRHGGSGMNNHVGLYAGNGYWIHCNSSRNGVTLERTNIFRYPRRFNIWKNYQSENKKESDEVVTKGKFKVNGKIVEVNRILKDNTNYMSLRDLEKLGILKLEYDENTKVVTINK